MAFWNLIINQKSALNQDPDGDYDFPDLVSFVQLVTFDDLRAAGLKVSGACKFEACIEPGGEVYNQLFLSRRLVPTMAEPPKHAWCIYRQILCL